MTGGCVFWYQHIVCCMFITFVKYYVRKKDKRSVHSELGCNLRYTGRVGVQTKDSGLKKYINIVVRSSAVVIQITGLAV